MNSQDSVADLIAVLTLDVGWNLQIMKDVESAWIMPALLIGTGANRMFGSALFASACAFTTRVLRKRPSSEMSVNHGNDKQGAV